MEWFLIFLALVCTIGHANSASAVSSRSVDSTSLTVQSISAYDRKVLNSDGYHQSITIDEIPSSGDTQPLETDKVAVSSHLCRFLCETKDPIRFFCSMIDVTGKPGPDDHGTIVACYKRPDKLSETKHELLSREEFPRDIDGVGDPPPSGQACSRILNCHWLCRLDKLSRVSCFEVNKSGQPGPFGMKWACIPCPGPTYFPGPTSFPRPTSLTKGVDFKAGVENDDQLSGNQVASHALPASDLPYQKRKKAVTRDIETVLLHERSIAAADSSNCKALTTKGMINCNSCSSRHDCRYLCQVVASKDRTSPRYCEPSDATGMYVEEVGTILCTPCSSMHAPGSTFSSSPTTSSKSDKDGDNDTTAHSPAGTHSPKPNPKHDFSPSPPPRPLPRYRLGCPKAQFKVGCTFLCHHDGSSSASTAGVQTWFRTCASDDRTDLSKGVRCTGCGPVRASVKGRRSATEGACVDSHAEASANGAHVPAIAPPGADEYSGADARLNG